MKPAALGLDMTLLSQDSLGAPDRLDTLRRTALLDSPAEESFDRLTRLVSRLLEVPVALVTLVDADRQFFKSQCGLAEPWASRRGTPLSHSFCQHVVDRAAPLVVRDAREHPLVLDNLAIRDLNVVAYLGIPLLTSDGHALGSFCAIDHEPRQWTEAEITTMTELAASVVTEIELRAEIAERRRTELALAESEARFRAIFHHAAIGIALVDMTGRCVTANPALCDLLGYRESQLLRAEFTRFTHPQDVDLDLGLFRELVRGERSHYQIEKRYHRRDGTLLWARLTVSLIRDSAGRPHYAVGMVEDISEHQRAERLAREVRILEGLLPICMFCKDIRNEKGEWERLECYIAKRSEADFSHGLCPDCGRRHYGDLVD